MLNKKCAGLVTAVLLSLIVGGPGTSTAQDPDDPEQEPTLCELLEATRDRACADAEEELEEAQTPEERAAACRLMALCWEMRAEHVDFCEVEQE